MYASHSLELFMHPLLVLFTWQKHFRKKKDVSQISETMANVIYVTGNPLKYQYKAPNKADVNAICTLHLHEHKW